MWSLVRLSPLHLHQAGCYALTTTLAPPLARITVADRAFVAYVDSDEFGRGAFGSFLARWLADRGVTDLFTLSGRAASRVPLVARNEKFIAEQRSSMRDELLSAARTGRLVYSDGPLVDVFVAEGTDAATSLELEELDH